MQVPHFEGDGFQAKSTGPGAPTLRLGAKAAVIGNIIAGLGTVPPGAADIVAILAAIRDVDV